MTDAQRDAHERMQSRLPQRMVVRDDDGRYHESAEVRSWRKANRFLSREEVLILCRLRRRGEL